MCNADDFCGPPTRIGESQFLSSVPGPAAPGTCPVIPSSPPPTSKPLCKDRPNTDCSFLDADNHVRRAASGAMCKEEVLSGTIIACKAVELMICCPTQRRKHLCELWFYAGRGGAFIPGFFSMGAAALGKIDPRLGLVVSAVGGWVVQNLNLVNALLIEMYATDLCECGVPVEGSCLGAPMPDALTKIPLLPQPLPREELSARIHAMPRGGCSSADDPIDVDCFVDLDFDYQ